jgi:hypothetical protein
MSQLLNDLHRQCDCATHTPSDDSRLVYVEQQCDAAFVTMLETLDTPPEHTAIVNVRCVVQPNSTSSWKTYGSIGAPCVQQFFFDTRRPFAQLRQVLARTHIDNHAATTSTLPYQTRQVARSHRHWCQCRRAKCIGDERRTEEHARRTRMFRHERSAFLPPINDCYLTSYDYDVIHGRARQLLADKGRDVDAEAPAVLVQPLLENWHLVDDSTGVMLVDDTPLARYTDCTCQCCSIDNDDDDDDHAHSDNDAYLADCLDSDALPSNANIADVASVYEVDVEKALQLRGRSEHAFGMCASWLRSSLEASVDTEQQIIAELKARVKACRQLAECDKLNDSLDDLRQRLASRNKVLRQPQHLLAKLVKLLDIVAHDVGRITARNDNCQCLFEQYLRHGTTQEINIRLVAQPNNVAYRDLGDSIWHIRSPLMRELALAEYMRRNRTAIDSTLLDIGFDKDALPGEPGHTDSVIANNAGVQSYLTDVFGQFSAVRIGRHNRLEFRQPRIPQRQHSFGALIKRQIGAKKHSALTGQLVRTADYDRLLTDTRAVFDLPDSVESLSEAVLERGLVGAERLWQQYAHWLPATVRALLVDHATNFGVSVERYALQMLDTPVNNRRIISTHCERGIVRELATESNRCMALARIYSALPSHIDCIGAMRQATVYCATVLAIVVHLDQLATEQRKRATAALTATTKPADPAPKKSGKQQHKKKPAAVPTKPDHVSTKPDPVSTKPDSVPTKPDHVSTKPDSVQTKPDSVQTKPDSVQTKPDSVQTKLDAVQTNPESVSTKVEDVLELQTQGWTVIGAPVTEKRKREPSPRKRHAVPARKSPRHRRYSPPPRQRAFKSVLTADAPPYVPLQLQMCKGPSLHSLINAEVDFDFFDLTLRAPAIVQQH